MPTSYDAMFRKIGDSLKLLTTDVGTLKRQVARLIAQDGGGYYLPFISYGSLSAGITASAGVAMATIPKQIVVMSWRQTWYMQSGDAANYWQVRLNTLAGNHYVFTTQPANGPVATWNRYDFLNLSLSLPENYRYIYIDALKVGTPGALYLACPAVYCI